MEGFVGGWSGVGVASDDEKTHFFEASG